MNNKEKLQKLKDYLDELVKAHDYLDIVINNQGVNILEDYKLEIYVREPTEPILRICTPQMKEMLFLFIKDFQKSIQKKIDDASDVKGIKEIMDDIVTEIIKEKL